MATKNFKNSGVMGAMQTCCASVFCFVWDNAILWIIAGAICLIWTLVCLVGLIISPLWFPVWTLRDPDSCARHLNMSNDYVNGWVARYLKWCTWALCHSSLWVNTPFIALLPMKYRAEFIRHGSKNVCDYSKKTQVDYFKSHCDESKQSLLSSGVFSPEVLEALWKDEKERDNWIAAGIELSRSQIVDLCQNGSKALLWRYFKQRTPNKEMYDLLLKYVREGYAAPAEVLINLLRQQRPNAELVGKLLNTGNNNFTERIGEVIDAYADLDAVDFGTHSLNGISDEEKQRIIGERWTNFCKNKKDICRAAQKKMGHAQYLIFAQTGHHLEYYALQHLCLSLAQGQRDYLFEIITNEFERIDEKLQTALKADYWRYSAYLAVKEARYAQQKTA